MTKQTDANMKATDDQLSQLYKQRKDQSLAPRSIKNHVLAKARMKDGGNHAMPALWQQLGAVGGMLVLAVAVWLMMDPGTGNIENDYREITLHTIEQQPDVSASRQLAYAKLTEAYQQQRQLLAVRHQQAQLLAVVEGTLQLSTCDKEILQISADLADKLRGAALMPGTVKIGDTLDIGLDQNGYITHIQPYGPALVC